MDDLLRRLDNLVTRERVKGYSLLLLVAFTIAAVWWFASLRDGIDPRGKPFGVDFIIFYAASDLSLKGMAVLAYAREHILLAEQAAVAASRGLLLWCYPPTFQLAILPLALAPYRIAYGLWVAITFFAYVLLVRRISVHPLALLVGCAFPAVFVNAIQGQNGFVSAALMGFGLLALDRRPLVAGLVLGLLAYKPHFGVLLPLLLFGTGRWRAAFGAALSSVLFVAATLLAFGAEPWRAFFDLAPQVSANLAAGALDWAKVPSVFIGLRSLGVPTLSAYAIHAAVAVPVAALTLAAWRAPGTLRMKAALAVVATLIVTPYAFDYDLVMLALPLGVMAERLVQAPGPPGARVAVALGFGLPVLMLVPAQWTGLQLAPLGLLWLFAATRRTLLLDIDAPGLQPNAPAVHPKAKLGVT